MTKDWTTIAVTREQHDEIVDRKPDELAINAYVMRAVRAKDREVDDLDKLADELTANLDRGRMVGPEVLKKLNELQDAIDELPTELQRRTRNR